MIRTFLQVSRQRQQHGSIVKRYLAISNTKPKKICIVGAGPAGLYAAQYMLKNLQDAHVDMIDKLPVPFGLVRFGVAPDHPEVKNVINTFSKTAENERFKFYGNISLGADVSLQQLRDHYHIVLLTYGADEDRHLGIANEKQANVLSARNFVAWYNGLPGAENLNPDLSGKNVVVVGQGNVAVDVARMLLSPIDELKKTDITSYALASLASSQVEKVYLVGRRGPLQVAFTIKELREMLRLPEVTTHWRPQDFEGVSEAVEQLARPRKRITELMLKSLKEQKPIAEHKKQFLPIFLRSPKIINDKELTFYINEMEKDNAKSTNKEETLPSDLVLRSIGYKSSCADDGICFDERAGRVANINGRVLTKDEKIIDKGLYVAGWLATGPTGVILTTMNVAFGVAKTICDDIQANNVDTDTSKPNIEELYKQKNYVSWSGWKKIDAEEVKRGAALGKPREKIIKINEMLQIAGV